MIENWVLGVGGISVFSCESFLTLLFPIGNIAVWGAMAPPAQLDPPLPCTISLLITSNEMTYSFTELLTSFVVADWKQSDSDLKLRVRC